MHTGVVDKPHPATKNYMVALSPFSPVRWGRELEEKGKIRGSG